MWFRNKKRPKQLNLSITNKTLKVDNPYIIYQISNIASVDKRLKKPGYNLSIWGIIVILLIGVLIFYNNRWPLSIWSLIGLAFMAVGVKEIYDRLTKKPHYGVFISPNDGKLFSIFSLDETLIENIISRLYDVMENEETLASYHFKIEGDLVQQSGNFGIGFNQGTIN